jgi:hypothetical protein
VLLHRLLGDVEIGGNLLVEPTPDHVRHDLALARREPADERPARLPLERALPFAGVGFDLLKPWPLKFVFDNVLKGVTFLPAWAQMPPKSVTRKSPQWKCPVS